MDKAKTAFFVELKFDQPHVTEFRYEKKTAKLYVGCEIVGHIVGRQCYLPFRVSLDDAYDSLPEALRRIDSIMGERMKRLQAIVNTLDSARGEIAKLRLFGKECGVS